MALKIRLRKQGRTNRPYYRLVVTDSRTKRDGAYVENLGHYDPLIEEGEKHLLLNPERIDYWLGQGAQMTEKAETLVAKGATDVYQSYRQKALEKRAKEAARKRASRKK